MFVPNNHYENIRKNVNSRFKGGFADLTKPTFAIYFHRHDAAAFGVVALRVFGMLGGAVHTALNLLNLLLYRCVAGLARRRGVRRCEKNQRQNHGVAACHYPVQLPVLSTRPASHGLVVKGKRISCPPQYGHRDLQGVPRRWGERRGFEHGFPLIRSPRASVQRSTSVLFSFVRFFDCGRIFRHLPIKNDSGAGRGHSDGFCCESVLTKGRFTLFTYVKRLWSLRDSNP